MEIQIPAPNGSKDGGCGRVAGTLFPGVFLVMGLVFCGLIAAETIREIQTWWWQPVSCEILSSSVEETGDDENPYRAGITYRYEVSGIGHTGSKASRAQDSGDYGDAQALVAEYPAGSAATCYVDTSQPELAILERRFPWVALFMLIPLVFVAIGGGGIWLMWRKGSEKTTRAFQQAPKSDRAGSRQSGAKIAVILGAIFLVVGSIVFVFIGVLPGLRLWKAQSWVEAPCTVISSTVRSHDSDDGTTFSIDILYEYRVGEQTWRSARYDFANWSSSGYRGKRAIVDRFPAGLQTVCFFDPENPNEAVLERGFRLAYLVGLAPLLFVFAGAAVLRYGLHLKNKRQQRSELAEVSGPVDLEPAYSPWVKLLGVTFFAAFWNGIISVFLYQLVDDWRHGSPDWFLTIFMVPFVLVGVGVLVAVAHSFLALFNPRPKLTLQPAAPRLGDDLHLEWRMKGAAGRIGKLTVVVEGSEEATYRRGTTTHTDREVFCRIRLADTTHDVQIARGTAQVTIPEDTMHSFEGTSNKIVWKISVAGDIPRWPDVSESFPIEIRPLRPST